MTVGTVHIVAVGACTAVGLTAESSAAAIRAGISRLAEHPSIHDSSGEPIRCARDAIIDAALLTAERMMHLADRALREVVGKLRLGHACALDIPVWLALPEERPGFSAGDGCALREALLKANIPNVTREINLVGTGHAGALQGLCEAVNYVNGVNEGIAIVGGVDSYLEPTTISWLERERRLAWSGGRGGFPPGEGAAMIVVTSEAARQTLGAESLGLLCNATCTHERKSPLSDSGSWGEGLTDAVLQATSHLHSPRDNITDVYADINGERHRTEDWGFALMRASQRMRDGTQYVTAVGSVGDVGAASAALGCVLAVEAWRRGYAVGPRALIWAGSWAGLRGAVTIEQRVG